MLYKQREHENSNVAYNMFSQAPDSLFSLPDSTLLAYTDRLERFDSRLDINVLQLKGELTGRYGNHHWRLGLERKSTLFKDDVFESVQGMYRLPTDPVEPLRRAADYCITGYSAFFQDQWQPFSACRMQLGVKYSKYSLNRESLLLPRLGLYLMPWEGFEVALNLGRYAQAPFYKELRHTAPEDRRFVKAQKADQVTLGLQKQWKHRGLSLKIEAFYRDYSDLISYDVYDVRTVYSGMNDARGFAYGYDMHFRGQWTEDCMSWISYSYLIARENITGDGLGWLPRPSDQRHTLSFKLEDKMPNYPGSRIHIRLLLGSGTPYTLFFSQLDENGIYQMSQGKRNAQRLHHYERFDVGLSQRITIAGAQVTFREEVLNLFNKRNEMGFSWFGNKFIPHYLSGRTFQLGAQAAW